jgi:murein DD-endopeptidase MepM/ murein hydrolase activator NlpD
LDRRKHLSLLVVRGDGARVARFNIPRRLPLVILAGVTVVIAALGVLVGDWWLMRTRIREAGGLFREVDAQRATISGFNRRMADLQREIASWRELHARIWEPFGPDTAPKGGGTGIGGPRSVDVAGLERAPQTSFGIATSEGLNRLAETVLQEGESLRALERLISRAGKALASLPSRWPVRGSVNSEFGSRQSPWTKSGEVHSGIDIGAERGTSVHAPAAGTVAFAGTHAEYGLTVMIDHGEDLRTIYGHLSKLSVTSGQQIARGDELGLTGNSGRSSGPHLHYEILVKNRPVNPRAYFWD